MPYLNIDKIKVISKKKYDTNKNNWEHISIKLDK